MSEVIRQCIERMAEGRARLAAGLASLTATVERWQPSSDITAMRSAMAGEPYRLPKWKKLKARQRLTLDTGDVIEFPKAHTVRTQYLRRDFNANDVALLQQIVEMQARTFTFEQIMTDRKFKATASQLHRARKGQL